MIASHRAHALLRTITASLFLLAFTACDGVGIITTGVGSGPGEPDATVLSCEFSQNPEVNIGGGSELAGYVPLDVGDDMVGWVGPQGLFMVTPSVRTNGLYPGVNGRAQNHPDDPEVTFETFKGPELIGGSARERLGLTPTAYGDERLAVFVPFWEEISEDVYVNQAVTLIVTVNDACGRQGSTQLDIIVLK